MASRANTSGWLLTGLMVVAACEDEPCDPPEQLDLTGLWETRACGSHDSCEIEQAGSALTAACSPSDAICSGSICSDRGLFLSCASRNGNAYDCTGTVAEPGRTASGTCTGPITCSATFARVAEP